MTTEMISEKAFSDHDTLTEANFAERTKRLPLRAKMVLRGLLGLEAGATVVSGPTAPPSR